MVLERSVEGASVGLRVGEWAGGEGECEPERERERERECERDICVFFWTLEGRGHAAIELGRGAVGFGGVEMRATDGW